MLPSVQAWVKLFHVILVGIEISPCLLNIMFEFLTEAITTKITGISHKTASAVASNTLTHRTDQCRCRPGPGVTRGGRRSGTTVTRVATAASDIALPCHSSDKRHPQEQDDYDQDTSNGRALAELAELEAVKVSQGPEHLGVVTRPPLGHHVDNIKYIQ